MRIPNNEEGLEPNEKGTGGLVPIAGREAENGRGRGIIFIGGIRTEVDEQVTRNGGSEVDQQATRNNTEEVDG